ncbi:PA2928 family protein [Arenimonas composti]|uniref:Phytase-like domain-containing protein n=1 Tax=Arenimonas composti TR7-09 = DSM 18010 TaxID=1121013 RepID=A0A091B6F7_9GAMM|nr:PA2928 family protein [Arenimonas composti]KFN48248.1 hypothetical protein P873_01440 [Arenimonas composti TR7-09 = DSM 18010]
MSRRIALTCLLVLSFVLAACSGSRFEPPQVLGRPALVEGEQPRLWVLTKQEEVREVRFGTGGGRNRNTSTRLDTFFHFELTAFDPLLMQPAWKQRLVSIGDPDARGPLPSRVIGSAVDGRLLGQDGDLVWLLIDATPFALSASDGRIVIDGPALEARRHELAGLLPADATHYGFDRGLVITTADARVVSVRGPEFTVADYVPPPPPVPDAPLKANGSPRIVPMRPLYNHVRHLQRGDEWIGLYSPKEAEAAAEDPFGDRYLFPYSILDEGTMARRQFWRGRIAEKQHFDERFPHIAGMDPVAGSPTFLRGRFLRDPRTDAAFVPADGGLLVWHLTRVDSDGRLALSRLDDDFQPRWTTELPLSESGTGNPVSTWILDDRVVAAGDLQFEDAERIRQRDFHLVSISLADGARRAWNLTRESPLTELEPR